MNSSPADQGPTVRAQELQMTRTARTVIQGTIVPKKSWRPLRDLVLQDIFAPKDLPAPMRPKPHQGTLHLEEPLTSNLAYQALTNLTRGRVLVHHALQGLTVQQRIWQQLLIVMRASSVLLVQTNNMHVLRGRTATTQNKLQMPVVLDALLENTAIQQHKPIQQVQCSTCKHKNMFWTCSAHTREHVSLPCALI